MPNCPSGVCGFRPLVIDKMKVRGLCRTSRFSAVSINWISCPIVLAESLRCASHIKIANRKKVEMFVGQRFHLPTRLRTAAPDVAHEWDSSKNPGHLYPEIVGVGCMEPVWWKCSQCSFSYKMSVEKRVIRGGGCPRCVDQSQLNEVRGADTVQGEHDPSLRVKRPPMLSLRTKY